MTDLIRLRDLRVVAVHGVLDEERRRAQPFEVDVDLEVDVAEAGRTDDLTTSVDYGAVCDLVARVVADESHLLLERVAHQICAAVLADQPLVDAITVEVRKLRPPLPHDVASSAVRIRRSRS